MLTKFSKWMVYLSSYTLLYFLLIIKLLIIVPLTDPPVTTIKDVLIYNFQVHRVLIPFLVMLLIISICWTGSMIKWHNNVRIKYVAKKNLTIEMIGFIIPFIVSMVTIDIDTIGIILNVALFFILGFAFVGSGRIYLSPTFLLFGYKLYGSGSNYILSRSSMEQINISLDENIDGIMARELSRNVYIVLKQ